MKHCSSQPAVLHICKLGCLDKKHTHNVNFTKLSISPPSSSAALWSEKIFQIQPHNETEADGKIT